jgi:predicted enzyme related to lactoylglutathione lyase
MGEVITLTINLTKISYYIDDITKAKSFYTSVFKVPVTTESTSFCII